MASPPTFNIKFREESGQKQALANNFRRSPTPAEAVAWRLLRGKQIHNLKFRRQQVISGFIVDFYCQAILLAVEIDGSIHDTPERKLQDREREQALNALGVRVMRIPNRKVTRYEFQRRIAVFLQD